MISFFVFFKNKIDDLVVRVYFIFRITSFIEHSKLPIGKQGTLKNFFKIRKTL